MNARARVRRGRQHRPVKRGRWHPVTTARRAWHTQPLRIRLVLITTGLLAIGLLVASLAVTSLLTSHLLGQVDDQLRVTAQAVGTQGLAEIHSGSESSMPSTYYVKAEYVDGQSGHRISTDTAAENGTPLVGDLSLKRAIAHADDPELITVGSTLPGRQWRVIILPISDSSTGSMVGVVAIALPLSNVLETAERTRLILALVDVAVILVGAMAATYLVRRSFRPLRQIEGVAGRIATGDLSARVPVTEPSTTEVGSLQRALNAMLSQNENAFSVQVVAQERMTRFVSDASHELRTPLAAIRGYGELFRMGGVPPERTPEVMGRIESEATRMGHLVDDLLQLARMDEGRKMEYTRVDLTAIASGALADMTVLAPDRVCELRALDGSAAEPGPLVVMGDKDRLSQVVTNLLGNVVQHTPAGSPVEIAIGSLPSPQPGKMPMVVMEVRDHGPGVPDQEMEKVFQRFYRSDTSRNRETGGSGLGLAIVAAIVARHGGTVGMAQTPGGGATVRIELPAAKNSDTPESVGQNTTE